MKLSQWRHHACSQLDNEDASAEARWLAQHVLGISPTEQRIHDPQLSDAQHNRLERLLKRRCDGEPLAYILGQQPFYTLDLAVNRHTLIPRPDSECLLEAALACAEPITAPRIADLGTGSGALALAFAQMRPDAQMIASDRSIDALLVAQHNAKTHALHNVTFVLGDWLTPFANDALDLILSNPPYIAEDDPHMAALRHEPRSALVAANNGYADLYRLIDDAPRVLKAGGWLLLEHGSQQAATLRAYAGKHAHWQNISSKQDYGSRDRVTQMQYGIEY